MFLVPDFSIRDFSELCFVTNLAVAAAAISAVAAAARLLLVSPVAITQPSETFQAYLHTLTAA